MDILLQLAAQFADLVLHLDKHLAALVASHGTWIYVILFVIIFAETGLVIFPFLPGDSLLFVAGALAALAEGGMDITTLIVSLTVAAVLGNSVNYQIGRYFGPRVFKWENSRFFHRESLEKTHAFYERHGGKTLVLSRFLPLFRSFAPFVAGIGAMDYGRFALYNLIGAVAWVVSLCLLGYEFGNIPVIRDNLSVAILGIIGISILPVVIGYLRQRGR